MFEKSKYYVRPGIIFIQQEGLHAGTSERKGGCLEMIEASCWPGQSPRSSQQEVRCQKSSAKRKEEEQLPEK